MLSERIPARHGAPSRLHPPVWDPDARARRLLDDREDLLRRLPRVIAPARALSPTQRADVVDDAIAELTVGYAGPIGDHEELERVFWAYARNLVAQALDGRQDTVRGRYDRAPETTLELIHGGDDPAEAVEAEQDSQLVREFAATLDADEAAAFAIKWAGSREAGARTIAQRLGISRAEARRLDRGIERKVETFALLFETGQLCRDHNRRVDRIAARRADANDAEQARAHVAHCLACRSAFNERVVEMRGAAFGRKVAGVLPIPAMVVVNERDRMRDWCAEFACRHVDKATAASDLATAAIMRGWGSVAGKVFACVSGGVATMTMCVATGVVPLPPLPDMLREPDRAKPAQVRPAKTATPAPTVAVPVPARAAATPAPTVAPKPRPKVRKKPARRPAPAPAGADTPATRARAVNPSANQAPAPAAPASPGSQPGGASEFGPSTATAPAPPAPPDPAPGASEFGP